MKNVISEERGLVGEGLLTIGMLLKSVISSEEGGLVGDGC